MLPPESSDFSLFTSAQAERPTATLTTQLTNGVCEEWDCNDVISVSVQHKANNRMKGCPVTDAVLGTICLILVLAVISDSYPA